MELADKRVDGFESVPEIIRLIPILNPLHVYRPSWLPPYVGARLHTPAAAKAVQAAVAVVATSAAISSIVAGIASVAATAPPIPSPKLLLSGLSLERVYPRLCLNDGVLSIARPILMVTTPVALSALIAISS